MRSFVTAFLLLLLTACGRAESAAAQMSPADQIARAVLAAPESLRADATVLGYGGEPREGDPLTLLRQGTNGIVCLADDPGDERFSVACYHESMDPFMAMGRRMTADGEDRAAVLDARRAAIEAGEMQPPAAALWVLSAESDVDPAVGPGDDARRRSVLYMPYAKAEELGLPTQPDGDGPWLMLPGQPWAHVMISQ